MKERFDHEITLQFQKWKYFVINTYHQVSKMKLMVDRQDSFVTSTSKTNQL